MAEQIADDTSTKQRIIASTTELFREFGYRGTSIAQIRKAAGVTTGSLYHFFPGGKPELTEAVLRSSGSAYRELVEMVLTMASGPETAMTDCFEAAGATMEITGWIDPCPVATIATELSSVDDHLRGVAAEVIATWQNTVAHFFRTNGIADHRANELATTAIATIEGAFILSRAQRDLAPMAACGNAMRQLVATELG